MRGVYHRTYDTLGFFGKGGFGFSVPIATYKENMVFHGISIVANSVPESRILCWDGDSNDLVLNEYSHEG